MGTGIGMKAHWNKYEDAAGATVESALGMIMIIYEKYLFKLNILMGAEIDMRMRMGIAMLM